MSIEIKKKNQSIVRKNIKLDQGHEKSLVLDLDIVGSKIS
jgi:hypothetical protein